MHPFYAGWLSLLPPVIAIVLALLTKEVITSLMAGILTGTLIYSIGMGLNPVVGTVQSAFAMMVKKTDLYIIIFCCLLGALVFVVSMAGGSKAYGRGATSKIRSKKSALISTSLLGVLIFIDDYFNCLTVGTVMKPVTDKYKISRAKLAYIIDSTAAPVCIIAPVSSWAAAVGSSLQSTGRFKSGLSTFIATIPFNLYAILTLIMLLVICLNDIDFGPMALREEKAKNGDVGAIETRVDKKFSVSDRGRVSDMLVPVGMLILFAVLGMLYNGGFWGTDPAYHSFTAAFGNCDAESALAWSCFGALIVAFIMFVPRRLMTFKQFMDGVVEGIKSMVPACVILLLAWTISGVCRDLLETAVFIKNFVAASSVPGALLPLLIFIISALLSFSTGTAWGTFGILIPIVVPVAEAVAPNLTIVSLSATLAGSIFGDHCSPISDTTILSSTGASCQHIEHVSTQLPYASLVAGCCAVGYLVAGFTNANLLLTLGTSVPVLLISIWFFHHKSVAAQNLRMKTSETVSKGAVIGGQQPK